MRIAAATASIKTTAFIDAFNALDDMEGIVRFRVPRAVAGDQKRNARRRPRRAFRNDPVTEVRYGVAAAGDAAGEASPPSAAAFL
jgi:hypothetical protein